MDGKSFLNFIGEVHPKLEYIQFVSVKNVDGYTDENGGWISEKDALDVYVVRTVIGTSHRLNRELMASRYGVPKISEKAVNTRISSYAGYPRYWWYFDIEEGSPRTGCLSTATSGQRFLTGAVNWSIRQAV